MDTLLLVFAKTPLSGTVKTRLAQSIGNEKALWVYYQLLKRTHAVVEELNHEQILFYSGEAPESFEPCFLSYNQKPQQGSDLGKRMAAAFQWGFNEGYKKIVGIGTDLWDLDAKLLESAFSELGTQEYVLGPASDGGYYLIGMKEPTPTLFQNKNWGTQTVLEETRNDLKGKSVGLLIEKNDIDTLADLKNTPELYTALKMKFND